MIPSCQMEAVLRIHLPNLDLNSLDVLQLAWNSGYYYTYEALLSMLPPQLHDLLTPVIYQQLVAADEELLRQELRYYSCGTNGECQAAWQGWGSLEECQVGGELPDPEAPEFIPEEGVPCQAVENRDVFYEIMRRAPSNALELPAVDQREVVRRILGFAVPTRIAHKVLLALNDNEWASLTAVPALRELLEREYSFPERLGRHLAAVLGLTSRVPVDYSALAQEFREAVLADEELTARLAQFYLGIPVPQEDPADNSLGEDSWVLIDDFGKIIRTFTSRSMNDQTFHDKISAIELLTPVMAEFLGLEWSEVM